MSLQQVITQIRSSSGDEEDWLLIHGDAKDLSLSTDCALAFIDCDEEDEFLEVIAPEYEARDLKSTIDYQTLEDCIVWADRLSGSSDDVAACEVIKYYIRFDTFPEKLGAPDPPSNEVILAELDREFYESLGDEKSGTECRKEDCSRGTVSFSVFCARHHFLQTKGRPYLRELNT